MGQAQALEGVVQGSGLSLRLSLSLSISTGGRVLARLARLKQVKPAAFYYGPVKPKRRRRFQGHAKRWHQGVQGGRSGHTGLVALKAYSRATSRRAKDFLAHPGSGTLVPPSWQWLCEAEPRFRQSCPSRKCPGSAT